MAKQPDDASRNDPNNIDQIRDIILGPQKRQTDHRFEQIAADLRRSQEESRAASSEIRENLSQEVARLQKALDQTQAALRGEMSAKIQQLEAALASARDELAATRAKHQSEIHLLKEEFSKELEHHVTDLRESNVSRETMADLLQELAVKLKRVEFLEELTNAVGRKSVR
ncbi:MAG: hypothetical protein IT282_12105 [Bacteroidetes bacterium]|nr:hypothetical protein [Bacteroidota bacterium]